MGRSLVRASLLRALLRSYSSTSSCFTVLDQSSLALPAPSTSRSLHTPNHASQIVQHFPENWFMCRSFSSGSSPSNLVIIKSAEEFNQSLKSVQDDGLSAIFYFTAVWCGPCKFISPVIEELSKKYVHVPTYKIDIDQEDLQGTLSNLQIFSVPTLHFFQNGKKVTEIVGADVTRLKETMETLYK